MTFILKYDSIGNEKEKVFMNNRVNLFDHPVGSESEFSLKQSVKNVFAFFLFAIAVYLFFCTLFCLKVWWIGDYSSSYMPGWHWPLKLLVSLFAKA